MLPINVIYLLCYQQVGESCNGGIFHTFQSILDFCLCILVSSLVCVYLEQLFFAALFVALYFGGQKRLSAPV